jgi:hypothetical protein
MDKRSTKSMDVIGELIASPRIRIVGPNRRAMAARRAFAAARRAQLPWLLALLPVGSLVAAGLLALLLSRFVPMTPAPPAADVTAVEFVGPTATSVDADGDEWFVPAQPAYTR